MKAQEILQRCPNTRCIQIEPGFVWIAGRDGRTRYQPFPAGKYILHMPAMIGRTKDGKTPLFFGFDSLSVTGERHGLPYINRCVQMCEKYGVIGVYPFPPQSEFFSLWHGWTTPGGAIRGRMVRDDIPFVAAVAEAVGSRVSRLFGNGDLQFCAAGFSDAGQFVQMIDLRMPGVFSLVISVNGTIDVTLPAPLPGSRIVVIHGGNNHVLPEDGGIGQGLIACAKCWVAAGARAARSRPDMQAYRYAVANGVLEAQMGYGEGFTVKRFGDAAVQFTVEGGGHEWFGRLQGRVDGQNVESLWSPTNKGPIATNFAVNETIPQECGWQEVARRH